jgi:hypothetical protein
MRLKIELPGGWIDRSAENPDGPPTFVCDNSANPGAFQVSWATYTGGDIPNPSEEFLEGMAKSSGTDQSCGELIESSSGTCRFGKMGTAVFRSPEYPRVQFWHLSNGRDFIMVTHICAADPVAREVREAHQIVATLTLGEDVKPKRWWFW